MHYGSMNDGSIMSTFFLKNYISLFLFKHIMDERMNGWIGRWFNKQWMNNELGYRWMDLPEIVGSLGKMLSEGIGTLEKRPFLYMVYVHSLSSNGTWRSSQKKTNHLDQSVFIWGSPLQRILAIEPPIKKKNTKVAIVYTSNCFMSNEMLVI